MTEPSNAPIILWFRRDLRLSDNPAFWAAAQTGQPIVAVFIRDTSVDALGAAPKWRLEKSLLSLGRDLKAKYNVTLVLRSGQASEVLSELVAQTKAQGVYWNRLYTPDEIARDTQVKSNLKGKGLDVQSFSGSLLFEPHEVSTKSGTPFQVYTPFWRAVKDRPVREVLPAPQTVNAHPPIPSEALEDWHLGAAMQRGADCLAKYVTAGEEAAQGKLTSFMDRIGQYEESRDCPSTQGTSQLSDHLAWGEISPHQIWHRVVNSCVPLSEASETYLKEIVWREFAYHLCFHTPHILTRNWKSQWDSFPWQIDENSVSVQAWKYGRTGIPFVDAAMREMYVTGRMHNRARMIAGSYLTKHMMVHWKIGMDWFAQCLVDWDPAANAMGWQWVAGSGPDASPFFRIFNPITQLDKFDPDHRYPKTWISELSRNPTQQAQDFFTAVPIALGYHQGAGYPSPIVDHTVGRKRALEAYEQRSKV